jgi:hypothetical protein
MEFSLDVGILVDLLYLAYRSFRNIIQFILENTLIKAKPTLASRYADATTLLVTLTAILIILEFVASAKKILTVIVALGWTFLIVSMVMSLI